MFEIKKITNTILEGDIIDNLKKIPSKSIDLIFADPPYFMQTEGELIRTEGTKFMGVEDDWDKFSDLKHYDEFSTKWLSECKRILNDSGSIWVIGSFQNIYRIGYIMQNLGFWILNDIVWSKPNPVPNFKGTRFTNSNETLIWCSKGKSNKYTFNYKTMKYLNNNKQMKSVWDIGICIGHERLKNGNGKKLHSAQKPEKLLFNVIISSSKPDDVVLDPFMGTGTTAVVAKRLGRNFIGIEREKKYITAAYKRINNENKVNDPIFELKLELKPPRVSLIDLINKNYLENNISLFDKNGNIQVNLLNDKVSDNDDILSIHKMAAKYLDKTNCNGWDFWYIKSNGKMISIDELRKEYRKKELNYVDFKL